MYKLPYFTEEDPEKVMDFMKEHPFALVTGMGREYPVATHLPLEINRDQKGSLIFGGHLMKNTDHHRAFLQNDHVTVIFHGPQTYVSASWYEQPAVASTWNYISVQAKGVIKFSDCEGTVSAVREITLKYEGNESAASFDKLSPAYISRLIPMIVAFDIEVKELENVFKLSQNHNEADRKSIIEHLLKKDDDQARAIAKEMKKRI